MTPREADRLLVNGAVSPEDFAKLRRRCAELITDERWAFQTTHKLAVDGVVGPKTFAALAFGDGLEKAGELVIGPRETDADLRARVQYVTGQDTCCTGTELDAVACRAGLRRR